MTAYFLTHIEWNRYIYKLRAMGHTPLEVVSGIHGLKLKVRYASGITDYVTEQELYQMDGKTPLPKDYT